MPARQKYPIVVREIPNEPLRYWASSQTVKSKNYVCDLTEYQGHGECFCTRFNTVCRSLLNAGGPHFKKATSCAHLRAVWRHFTITTLPSMARLANEGKLHPRQ